MNFPWDQLLVKGNWMITMAQIGAPFLDYWFNRSNYLLQVMEISLQRMVSWTIKIGLMYLICAVLMFVQVLMHYYYVLN